MEWALFLPTALLAFLWLAFGALYLAASRKIRILAGEIDRPAPSEGSAPAPPLPAVTIVVTARDEILTIEATLRSLLGQRYPGLEVIAVDDRSSDGTGEVLDRLAAGTRDGGPGPSPSLQVVHVDRLPAGWIGKSHACHAGAGRARGDWILFMDGDVTLEWEDLLSRTVAWAERGGLDHVGVYPDVRPFGPLQGALLFAFEQTMLLAIRAWEMDRDRPRGGGGVGAFNLVRRRAYERIGGHERRLRLEVADDYKLGMLLKESGARQRILSGIGLMRCPWHRGAGAIVRGLEKNLFAGAEYSVGTVLASTAGAIALQAGPLAWAVLAGGGLALAPLLLQVGTLLAAATAAAPRIGGRPLVLWALYPIASVILVGAVWNSTFQTLRRGGVVWRGTFYPLAELRRACVRPGDGRRS